MPYNFEFAVSAQISEKVVKEMITKVVEEQTGKKVASIDIKITDNSFTGCTVYFTNEKMSAITERPFKSDQY